METIIDFFIIGALFGGYQFFFNKKIIKEGVYTKCILVNAEGYKGGIIITIKYKFGGKEFEGRLNSHLSKEAIGNQYFVKVRPEYPDNPIFLKESPVPDCLLTKEAPPNGWKEIPKCN